MNGEAIYNRMDNFVLRGEARWGRYGFGIAVTFLLMVAAALYVEPAIECVVLGKSYAQLASHPFHFNDENIVAYRILTPLISYLLGLRGELIIITNLLFAAVLIGWVYFHFRRHAPRPGDALAAAGVITFSLVTLTTLRYGGYTDSATYLIIFLMWKFRRRRFLFYVLFLLGLLNRESILFLIPWFVLLRAPHSGSKMKLASDAAVGFGITILLYALFRQWASSHYEVGFTWSYYLEPLRHNPFYWFGKSFTCLRVGFFSVFKLLWLFPILAGFSLWQRKERRDVYSMLLLFGCSFAQLFVAFDSSRMLTMSFPVMLIALEHLFRHNPFRFRELFGWVFAANLIVPQLYTANNVIEVMPSLIGDQLRQLMNR